MLWMRPFGERKNDDRRQCGRLKTEFLHSNLGRVVNLSGSGLLVISPRCLVKEQGKTMTVVLRAYEQECRVPCTVVRSERLGFRRHKIGLTFLDVEEARPVINALLRESVLEPGLGNQHAAEFEKDLAA